MKVGDYVRTKYGEICKLKKSKYKDLLYETDIEIDRHVDRDCNDYGFDSDTIKDVIKSSPNIIDLIEIGDYVNGSLVEFSGTITWDKDMKPITKAIKVKQGGYDVFLNNENIKSIVTHEQFSQMEYRIGE